MMDDTTRNYAQMEVQLSDGRWLWMWNGQPFATDEWGWIVEEDKRFPHHLNGSRFITDDYHTAMVEFITCGLTIGERMIVSPNNISYLFKELMKKVVDEKPTCDADRRRQVVLLRKLQRRVEERHNGEISS